MFYLFGVLLFALTAGASLVVLVSSFADYRVQMMAALKTLSLDGIASDAMVAKPHSACDRTSLIAARIRRSTAPHGA